MAMAELPPLLLDEASASSRAPTDASSHVASLSSTPPTTVADNDSFASDPPKPDLSTPVPMPEADERVEASVTVALDDYNDDDDDDDVQLRVGTPADDSRTPPAAVAAAAAAVATPTSAPTSARRARHPRTSSAAPVYNLAKLSGTDVHGKRRAKGDIVSDKRRRTISGDTLVNDGAHGRSAPNASLESIVKDGIEALDLQWSIKSPKAPRGAAGSASKKMTRSPALSRRVSTRSSSAVAETFATRVSALGKRGRKALEKGASRMSRELRRLQDTKEFAHVDDKPVLHTVWSNGKFVDPSELESADAPPARKRRRTAHDDDGDNDDDEVKAQADEPREPKEETPAASAPKQKRVKKWLEKGLYAGQEAPSDITKCLTAAEKKKLKDLPELEPAAGGNTRKILPMPLFNGYRMLINGRDFKLPYDVCNPLPPGQPKPDEWRKMTRNRFVGDAATYWRKTDHFKDYQSKCVCTPEDGCSEDCQNRIMLYECDEMNCNAGKEFCCNRAFQNLQERTKKGGRYRVGVEVMKTSDRGYGVRTNRCFEPNQIIMEYTGEIITEAECERRMNELYKDNECYYLMSFDQNMIIDATTGNIARFVNHSCSPNCRMEKWIVGGQPRMALFAGDRPIMTGEELTYDYNFDPFSAKNVQKCLCGSPNCRGVLGPKKREEKPRPEAGKSLKEAVRGKAKTGKRKLKELLGGQADDAAGAAKSPKKRKVAARPVIKTSTQAIKRSLSSASLKAARSVARGAATVVKRAASTISFGARAALVPATPARRAAAIVRKSASATSIRTYSKHGRARQLTLKAGGGGGLVSASRRSSGTTIVAHPDGASAASSASAKPKAKGGRSPGAASARGGRPRKSGGGLAAASSPGSAKAARRKSAPSPGQRSAKSPRKGLELSRGHKIRRVVTEDD